MTDGIRAVLRGTVVPVLGSCFSERSFALCLRRCANPHRRFGRPPLGIARVPAELALPQTSCERLGFLPLLRRSKRRSRFRFLRCSLCAPTATERSSSLGFGFGRPDRGMRGLQKPSGMKCGGSMHPTGNPLNSSRPASDGRFGPTGVGAGLAFTWRSAPECQVSVLNSGARGLSLTGR